MQQQPPHHQSSKFSPTLITTEQIQKCLEENQRLIMAIMEYRKQGLFQECAEYQVVLQKNLMYLAALADAQPPTPEITNPSQVSSSFIYVENNFVQQPQLVIPRRSSAGESSVQKLPFQQQQQQMLQFQQLQQLQGQMGVRPGTHNNMFGMHQAMEFAFMSNHGGQQDGSEGHLIVNETARVHLDVSLHCLAGSLY
ncbi:GRF1-interacting factor 2-like [Rutidosis leptorrhynchoides]|uniref:GRF1-interacting factor 2-like n=1 Tax=Rutidosis leptorrhynchoides TaxID=125765 RepID=UPI003A9A5432